MKKKLKIAVIIFVFIMSQIAGLQPILANDVFEWVVEPTYYYLGPIGYQYHHGTGLIWPFYDGMKSGYMNFNGVAREPVYDFAEPYKYGYARVMVGGLYGYIRGDNRGFLIEPQFGHAGDFEFDDEGSASAWVGGNNYIRQTRYYSEEWGGFYTQEGDWEIIPVTLEERGYTLVSTDEGVEFYEKIHPYIDGAARVERYYRNNGSDYMGYSYVNLNGEQIGGNYESATDFNSGVAVVIADIDSPGHMSYGLIDNTGNFVYGFQKDIAFMGGFVEGYCTAQQVSTGKFGVVKLSQSRTITVNSLGYILNFDQPPIMESGRVLVPVRKILESLFISVDWDDDTQTVIATEHIVGGFNEIRLTVNSTTAYVNSVAVELEVPPRIVNGRVLVPVRFIAEASGRPVEWDAENMTVIITQGNKSVG